MDEPDDSPGLIPIAAADLVDTEEDEEAASGLDEPAEEVAVRRRAEAEGLEPEVPALATSVAEQSGQSRTSQPRLQTSTSAIPRLLHGPAADAAQSDEAVNESPWVPLSKRRERRRAQHTREVDHMDDDEDEQADSEEEVMSATPAACEREEDCC